MKRFEENRRVALLVSAKIHIYDREEYEPGMDNNGGHYEMWREFVRHSDSWVCSYHASHEFGTCRFCGMSQPEDPCQCGEKPEVVSPGFLSSLLEKVERDNTKRKYGEGEGKAKDWSYTLPDEHLQKIRRRIEDYLRKTRLQSEVLEVANQLFVKLD
jgi:hypothetical protein